MMGVSMSACAGVFGIGGKSWKEEVLLHDGSKIVVERSVERGGRHEIGQEPPIKEQSLSFIMPDANKTVTWTSDYSDDVGHSNFDLLALHVLNGMPYIVTFPNGHLAYTKWGSPNPPYVFFKYDGKIWQRISLEELPAEFKTINVALDVRGREVEELDSLGFVSAEKVRELNAHTTIPEFKTIVRTPLDAWAARPEHRGPKAPHPIASPTSSNSELIRTEDGWPSPDMVELKRNYWGRSPTTGDGAQLILSRVNNPKEIKGVQHRISF